MPKSRHVWRGSPVLYAQAPALNCELSIAGLQTPINSVGANAKTQFTERGQRKRRASNHRRAHTGAHVGVTNAGDANAGGANAGDPNAGDANAGGANASGAIAGGANAGDANTGGANAGH